VEFALKHELLHMDRITLLIAGLGNVLLMDDGVGVHAVRELKRDPIEGTRIIEIGTSVIDGLHLLEAADQVIALDAIQAGAAPGTVYQLSLDALENNGPRTSLHELDLRAVLRFIPEPRRPEVTVLGVEPLVIDYGLELSPPVSAAMTDYLSAIRSLAASLLRRQQPGVELEEKNT